MEDRLMHQVIIIYIKINYLKNCVHLNNFSHLRINKIHILGYIQVINVSVAFTVLSHNVKPVWNKSFHLWKEKASKENYFLTSKWQTQPSRHRKDIWGKLQWMFAKICYLVKVFKPQLSTLNVERSDFPSFSNMLDL